MPDLTHPSPHFNSRNTHPIRVLVLHSSAGPSDKSDLAWMMDPASKVSYHALVGRNGSLYTLVDPKYRAWHAGVAEWNGVKDVNAVSLGVSFSNAHDGKEALTPLQIAVMLGAVEGWARTIPTLEAITTHRDIAPQRKSDPFKSVGFDFRSFQEAFQRGVASRASF